VSGSSVDVVDGVLAEPVVVLLAVALAASLFVIEAALPTMGLAGTLGLVLGIAAVVGISESDDDWWPLLGPMLAVALWAVLVASRTRSRAVEAGAVGLFAGGSLVFGVLAESPLAAGFGVAIAVPLGAGFPHLHGRARRLLDQQPRVGLEAYVGRTTEVVRWQGTAGTVRLEGSLWNATSPHDLDSGDPVTVTGHHGSTLEVAPRLAHPAT
jgi:membrane-bound ClpP family serine protease